MTSGAIQAYVPAVLILVVLCHSLARPKSVIFNVKPSIHSFSMGSARRTGGRKKTGELLCNNLNQTIYQSTWCLLQLSLACTSGNSSCETELNLQFTRSQMPHFFLVSISSCFCTNSIITILSSRLSFPCILLLNDNK